MFVFKDICIGYVSRTVSMMDATKLIHKKD